MENNRFKVIIVEDVKLELKGTEEIFRHEIPDAEVIGTAMTEKEFWNLLKAGVPDIVLLDLGLRKSTTIGVAICSPQRKNYRYMKVLIFTGEILNEKLWVDALNAGSGWYNPENTRVADRHRCTGGYGRQKTCFQLSHYWKK